MSLDETSEGGARQAVRRFLRWPAVNALMRTSLRPFARWLPVRALCRLPVVGEVTASLPSGARLRLGSDGRDLIASALYWRGLAGYEPETFAALWKVSADVRVLFDVGASTGVFTLAAALEDRTCRVFAFEPGPGMAASLERNIALNGLTNATPVAAAACDHDGLVGPLSRPADRWPSGPPRSPRCPGGVRHRVRALRLDSFASKGIARVDLPSWMPRARSRPSSRARSPLERDQPWTSARCCTGSPRRPARRAGPLRLPLFRDHAPGRWSRGHASARSPYRTPNWLFATERRLGACPLA